MKKYLGIIVLLIGAFLLIITGLTHCAVNAMLGTGFVLILVGFILHIILSKVAGRE